MGRLPNVGGETFTQTHLEVLLHSLKQKATFSAVLWHCSTQPI